MDDDKKKQPDPLHGYQLGKPEKPNESTDGSVGGMGAPGGSVTEGMPEGTP